MGVRRNTTQAIGESRCTGFYNPAGPGSSTSDQPHWYRLTRSVRKHGDCAPCSRNCPGSAVIYLESLQWSISSRGLACHVDRLGLILKDFENLIETGDLKQALDSLRWIQNSHMSSLIANRGPDSDELSQTRAIDVLDV